MAVKYPKKRKMVFTKDQKNPTKEKKTMRDSKNVSETLPTKNGIYKRLPADPPASKTSNKTKKKRVKLGPLRKKKVQFSSHKKAKKNMMKNVKARQKGKIRGNGFNR